MSRRKIESPVGQFFYNLLFTPKPDFKSATDNEKLKFMLKFYAGLWFFKLGNKYHKLLTWLTKYYPFSLLFQWRLYHAKNAQLRSFVDSIEKTAQFHKIPISFSGWDIENNMAVLYFKVYWKKENIEIYKRKLEPVLQEKYTTIYLRNEGKYLKILIPLNLININ